MPPPGNQSSPSSALDNLDRATGSRTIMPTSERQPVRMLLVDSQRLMRMGLRTLLSGEAGLDVVGEAGDGEEAIIQVEALAPDVVIMDTSMPGPSGMDVTRRILTDAPHCKVIALSIHSGKRFVEDMLDAGASAYLLKESAPEELVQGIRAVMRGDVYLSSAIAATVVSAYDEVMSAEIDLVQTKLHRPTAPPDLVPRMGLLEHLNAGRARPLTLVSAPAGYGKSVTISSWLDSCDWPSVWLSLDDGDSELRLFLSYFLAAVRGVFPGSCEQTLRLLDTPRLPPLPVLMVRLSNELDALDKPLLVVLDDYHCIGAESSVNDLLSQLLLRPPIPLHLVILTRRDPPLPVVKLRARDQVTDVRMQDLRFAAQEVRALLENNRTVSVSDAALDNLDQEMEGWAVGLRLVSLALRCVENPDRFLMDLHGGLQQTYKYLLHEVVAGQAPAMRDWLLKTAIVDQFCQPLCEAVCAAEGGARAPELDAAKFIETLVDNNLFTIPLDSRGEWFRYHHLFQLLLQQELENFVVPREVAALHLRASAWFEDQGFIEQAIRHAAKAGDMVGAAEILERHRRAEQDHDGWRNVERWLAILPAETREQRPDLLLTQVWILQIHYQLRDIIPIVARLELLADQDMLGAMAIAELNVYQGVLRFWEGRVEESQKHLLEARKRIPLSYSTLTAGIELYLALSTYMTGQGELALQRLSDVAHEGAYLSDKVFAEVAVAQSIIHMLSGELSQAAQDARSVLHISKQAQLPYLHSWGVYLEASSHFRAHELEAALPRFILLSEQQLYSMHVRAAVDAMVGLALTYQAMSRPDAAAEVVRKLLEFARKTRDPQQLSVAQSGQARVALAQGDLESVARWLQSFHEEPFAPTMLVWLEVPCVTQARVLVAIGSPEGLLQATELLATLRQANEALHNICQTIEIVVLQSLTLLKQGHAGEARQALKEALELARPGRWIQPFIEPGPPMADLLKQVAKEDNNADFAEQILAHFVEVEERDKANAQLGRAGQTPSERLNEPLTNRELDILELLAQRLQNKEIAARLFVSSETVKTHLKHLYQKLAVSNRREAAAKAIEILDRTRIGSPPKVRVDAD